MSYKVLEAGKIKQIFLRFKTVFEEFEKVMMNYGT